MFNSIGFLTYYMREGREQVSISLCEGQVPIKLAAEHPKRYVTNLFWSAITILLHFSFWIFNILYKHINKKRYLEYQNFEQRLPKFISKENIFEHAGNVFGIIFIFLILATSLPNNLKHPRDLEKYPSYLTIYFEHCISPNLTHGICMVIFLAKNKRVRSEVWQVITAAIERLK